MDVVFIFILVTRITVVLMPHYVELCLGCGNIPDISIGGDGFKYWYWLIPESSVTNHTD